MRFKTGIVLTTVGTVLMILGGLCASLGIWRLSRPLRRIGSRLTPRRPRIRKRLPLVGGDEEE